MLPGKKSDFQKKAETAPKQTPDNLRKRIEPFKRQFRKEQITARNRLNNKRSKLLKRFSKKYNLSERE